MLTEQEYALEQKKLGRRIHAHDGVWWEEPHRFFCKPAFQFRAFKPGMAKPALAHSLLAYSHQVPDPAEGNRRLSFLVLEGDCLRNFGLTSVKAKKRNQIRKGLDACEVKEITELEPQLEIMRMINISQARRQQRRDVPPEYYVTKRHAWEHDIRLHFAHKGYTWRGAFHRGRLVAYMASLQVEGITFIQVVKSETESLSLCPTDALYYSALSDCGQYRACEAVVNGGPLTASLDHFKAQYLFTPKSYSYFVAGRLAYSVARLAGAGGRRLLDQMRRARQQ